MVLSPGAPNTYKNQALGAPEAPNLVKINISDPQSPQTVKNKMFGAPKGSKPYVLKGPLEKQQVKCKKNNQMQEKPKKNKKT